MLAGAAGARVLLCTDGLTAQAVQPAPDALRQARWHRQLADAYEGLGKLSKSRQHAERAVAFARLAGTGDPATVAE